MTAARTGPALDHAFRRRWWAFMTLLSRITGMLQSRLLANYLGAGPGGGRLHGGLPHPQPAPPLHRRRHHDRRLPAHPERGGSHPGRGRRPGDGGPVPGHPGGVPDPPVRPVPSRPWACSPACRCWAGWRPEVRWWQQFGVLWEVLAGTRAAPVQWVLTTTLARIMIPYLVLVSLTAGLSAVLNLRGRFGLPASVSTFWNLAFISFGWACLQLGPRRLARAGAGRGVPGPGHPGGRPGAAVRPVARFPPPGLRHPLGPVPAPPGRAQRPEAHGPRADGHGHPPHQRGHLHHPGLPAGGGRPDRAVQLQHDGGDGAGDLRRQRGHREPAGHEPAGGGRGPARAGASLARPCAARRCW